MKVTKGIRVRAELFKQSLKHAESLEADDAELAEYKYEYTADSASLLIWSSSHAQFIRNNVGDGFYQVIIYPKHPLPRQAENIAEAWDPEWNFNQGFSVTSGGVFVSQNDTEKTKMHELKRGSYVIYSHDSGDMAIVLDPYSPRPKK